jgi:hypothetical protein
MAEGNKWNVTFAKRTENETPLMMALRKYNIRGDGGMSRTITIKILHNGEDKKSNN